VAVRKAKSAWAMSFACGRYRAPPGVHNLEAMHTLALFWALFGMLFPTFFAASVYLNANTSDTSEFNTVREGGLAAQQLYTPMDAQFIGVVYEPFAGLSNFAYFTTGLGLYLMPQLSGDDMPASTSLVALFICILGASSGAFHVDGSKMGTWQHSADRFAMYMPFGFLSVCQLNGTLHAIRGVPATPRSLWSLLTSVGGVCFAMYCLVYQDQFESMNFLIGTGFVAFTADFVTMIALHFHLQTRRTLKDGEARSCCKKLCYSIARALPTLAIRLSLLGTGFWCNMAGAQFFKDSVDGNAHGGMAPTVENRIEWRMQHDFLHGTWHFWSSIALMGLGLSLTEGLSGELRPPASYRMLPMAGMEAVLPTDRPSIADTVLTMGARTDLMAQKAADAYARFFYREDPYEICSMVITALLVIIFATLNGLEVSAHTWLVTWLVLVAILFPWQAFALYRICRKHTRSLKKLGDEIVDDANAQGTVLESRTAKQAEASQSTQSV